MARMPIPGRYCPLGCDAAARQVNGRVPNLNSTRRKETGDLKAFTAGDCIGLVLNLINRSLRPETRKGASVGGGLYIAMRVGACQGAPPGSRLIRGSTSCLCMRLIRTQSAALPSRRPEPDHLGPVTFREAFQMEQLAPLDGEGIIAQSDSLGFHGVFWTLTRRLMPKGAGRCRGRAS